MEPYAGRVLRPGEPDSPRAHAMIPGAYELDTLTHRQAGSMSGPAYGSADAPMGPSSMDAATIAAREMEGGGGVSQRAHRVGTMPQAGRPAALVTLNADRPTQGYSWLQFWHFVRR